MTAIAMILFIFTPRLKIGIVLPYHPQSLDLTKGRELHLRRTMHYLILQVWLENQTLGQETQQPVVAPVGRAAWRQVFVTNRLLALACVVLLALACLVTLFSPPLPQPTVTPIPRPTVTLVSPAPTP